MYSIFVVEWEMGMGNKCSTTEQPLHVVKKIRRTSTTQSCKGNRRGKINSHKKKLTKKVLNLWLNNDVTTKTCHYVKHVYWKLFRQPCIRNFWFGILIIMIHRFTLHMQEKWENQKWAITLATHILAFKYYVHLIIARHIIDIT